MEQLRRIEKEELAGKRKVMMKNIKRQIQKAQGKKLRTTGAFGRPPEYMIKKVELEVV